MLESKTKESNGSNYFDGDVIYKVKVKKFPDHSIFGSNPIEFITTHRKAYTQIEEEYGEKCQRI